MKLHPIKHLQKADSLNAEKLHVLSHELRTPLAVISGYAQVLREELSDEKAELVSPILENVSRLDQVISTLLEWQTVSPSTPAVASNNDMCSVVKQVVGRYSNEAAEKGIDLEIRSQKPKIASYSSPEVVESSLSQVLHNAIKYSSEGTILIQIEAVASRIEITVEDNGPGIGVDHADLFEPYVQGSIGLNRSFNGLGLGLTLARTHLLRIDGTISLQNGHGGGALATLSFPRFASATSGVSKRRVAA